MFILLIARQVKSLKAEHQQLKERLERIKGRARELERINVRSALLGPSSIPSDTGVLTQTILQEREDNTLRYSETRISEYINLGTSTLESLRNQKSVIKSTHRKILDAGNRLGISQSVMRMISRKSTQDRFIFYGGVIAVIFVIYLCWRYL